MKTKQLLFTVGLTLLFFISKAQQVPKYEFMTISYYVSVSTKAIIISIDGKDFIKEEVDLEKDKADKCNTNPLLLKIKEYQDKNWEVMTFNTVPAAANTVGIQYIAYLRKKKE